MEKPSYPAQCENCDSTVVARISYGLPDERELAAAAGESVILGGCDISSSAPQWHCTRCKHEWGVTEWEPILRKSEQETRARLERKNLEALARGILQATVTVDDIARCPHCNRSFDLRASMSWDGARHTTCGTYLQIGSAT